MAMDSPVPEIRSQRSVKRNTKKSTVLDLMVGGCLPRVCKAKEGEEKEGRVEKQKEKWGRGGRGNKEEKRKKKEEEKRKEEKRRRN